MAALNELIQKVENPELRAQLQAAADKLAKQKKFGPVFEEHLPECTPLYDIPVRKGAKVSVRNGKANETYTVLKIENDIATCLPRNSKEAVKFSVDKLVTTAELGDPIYPCLQPLGEVCNAMDSELWHTLIEADNYHALQLLEYLYAGKVDCIYIDPPYNTGAKDWKYNNDYVDSNDQYRHSKWLSMMQKRLEIAKRLLNPNDSVPIVTIDEKEYLHLGCLLEETFPAAGIQMVTSVINQSGVARTGQFYIKNAVSLELLPVQGQTMSLADIERRLTQLDEQFQRLLAEAIDAEDKEASNAQFVEILSEQTSLKRQKEAILQSSTDADRVSTRMKQAEQAIENTAQTITEWNENAVRQIVERVTVLSADEVLVRIKGGAEIKQTINK